MSSRLFQPLALGGLELPNRIVIEPMCQYSASDGCMSDWHVLHLGQLALAGAGLLTVEATAVLPDGRITPFDVGLYDDSTERAMARTFAAFRRYSSTPLAIQLAHAGRKASTDAEWRGMGRLAPSAGGWQPVGPSALPFDPSDDAPLALDRDGIRRVRAAFAASAVRAARIGLDAIHPVAPGYQIPLARAVKACVPVPIVGVGMISSYDQAEALIADGEVDLVGLARALLVDPRWPWHAAEHLGGRVRVAAPYVATLRRRSSETFVREDEEVAR